MKKSNIIFFTWENEVFLKRELDKWIALFIEKYWEFNISRFNKENISGINIWSELMALPFLAEFKLIIFNEFPSKAENKEETIEEKVCPNCWQKSIKSSPSFICPFCKFKEEIKSLDNTILSFLDSIPDKNIVIFIQKNPDKRTWLYKKLLEIATLKEFKNLVWDSLRDYIRSRLINIDSLAIKKLIEYKNSDISKIDKEIDKLELFDSKERITEEDIIKYVIPEMEVSIFKFIDSILELNSKQATYDLDLILETSNIYQIFSSIITNLRSLLYIQTLMEEKISKEKIIAVLGVHPFIFEKARINYKSLKILRYFFSKLIEIDKKAKIWDLVWDQENSIRLALEKEIFNLQKF